MTNTEKKIVYSVLIIVMSLLFSGYTIRNAEYMLIADKYIDDFDVFKRSVRYSVDIKEIEQVRERLKNKRTSFMNEVKSSYSSKISDRLMLRISCNKFDSEYEKIMKYLNGKTQEIAPEKNRRMISISFSDDETGQERNIKKTEEKKETVKESRDERKLVTIWKRVSPDMTEELPVNTLVFDEDELTCLKAVEVKEGKETGNGEQLKDILDRYNLTFDSNIKKNTFFEGKDLVVGNERYIYKDGKYISRLLDKDVEFDSVVVRLESKDLPDFGKALIYNGREFLIGAWMTDEDGIDFFDNKGKVLRLSEGRVLITKAQAEEVDL